MEAELQFPVMGTTAHVVAVAASRVSARSATERARERLAELEGRWSRFLPGSEVSALNAAGGAPVVVTADTRALVARAVEGWRRTGGRFDPTVLDALVALGYDRDFAAVAASGPAGGAGTASPVARRGAPGCAGVVVDRVAGTVTLPPGVRFDPGGIGKGLAADLVVTELLASGADGVCVNVGGDLRVEGRAPGPAGWVVDLEHPFHGRSIGTARLRAGAVASTWRTRRTWGPPPFLRHHLVDPATGAPARSGLAGATVLAGRAWWAEVLAKAAFVDGLAAGLGRLRESGVGGFLVDDEGVVHPAGAVARFAA